MVLHIASPLAEADPASRRLGKKILLKMDCYQPTGSFKIRGIGRFAEHALSQGRNHLVSSSGGNAGYSAAYAGRALGLQVSVVVPETTPAATRHMLAGQGARVTVHGSVWDEADVEARALAARTNAAYVSPFNDPVLWDGHSTLVAELAAAGVKPDAIVLSVGGGGLLCGVMVGLDRLGWHDVTVVAVETEGADSLAQSIAANRLVTLPAITSVAKSLGALRVAPEALAWTQRHPTASIVVPDRAATDACVRFATEHRALVEPACGASLSVVYDNHPALAGARTVVVVVCGGINVGAQDIHQWALAGRDAAPPR